MNLVSSSQNHQFYKSDLDLDLDRMTLVLKLDLDMFKMYHYLPAYSKNKSNKMHRTKFSHERLQ